MIKTIREIFQAFRQPADLSLLDKIIEDRYRTIDFGPRKNTAPRPQERRAPR